MSYILDALKRAESERSRGEVPNIHAQPGLAGDGDVGASGRRRQAAAFIVAALLLGATAVGWWVSGGRTEAPPPVTGTPAGPAVAYTPPAVAPATPVPASTPRLVTSQAKAPPPVFTFPLPQKQSATANPKTPEAVTSAPAPVDRVYAIKELPDHIRNSLPQLRVGGATYSESAANRMLIVNGNIFHEGDKLTAEVSLQEIQLRSAVLTFRGYRYSISY